MNKVLQNTYEYKYLLCIDLLISRLRIKQIKQF